jgi:Alpha/beta hydrolase family
MTVSMLLLHGSFHGGWCWDPLAPFAEHNDWLLHRPDFQFDAVTGFGDHVNQARFWIEKQEPDVVVAHSYAGLVLPHALARTVVRPRLNIFLDAFLPRIGRSGFDDLGEMGALMRSANPNAIADFMLVPPDPRVFGNFESSVEKWVRENLKAMAWTTHEVAAEVDALEVIEKAGAYIRCTDLPVFLDAAERASRAGWPLIHLPTCHDVMITNPECLARCLSERIACAL